MPNPTPAASRAFQAAASPNTGNGSPASGGSQYLTGYTANPFATSSTTDRYLQRLNKLEKNAPGEFQSQYSSDIQNIINSIKNREQFKTDDVFQSDLYTTMRDQAIKNGQKSMRDTMGSAQAATGGYGSTYAQAAGSRLMIMPWQTLTTRRWIFMIASITSTCRKARSCIIS